MMALDLSTVGRGQMDLGYLADSIRAWSVPLTSRRSPVCRFVLTRWGARVAVEGGPGYSDGAPDSHTIWHMQLRVRRPTGISDSPSSGADLVTDAKRPFWRQCFFSGQLEHLCMQTRASRERRALVKNSLLLVHQHLCSLMDPAAKAVAERFAFGSGLRWFIYETTVNDPSGHLTQAADTCPGLLILASQMSALGLNVQSRRIVDGLCQGRPLGRVLAAAIDDWATAIGDQRREDRAAAIEAQRLRIRRAGTLVPPALLWPPCHDRVIPEDIPAEPRDNLTWFELVHAVAAVAADPRLSPRQRTALGAFASHHALRLVVGMRRAAARPDSSAETVLASLVDYLAATNRVPARGTDPDDLLRESLAWHRDVWRRPYVSGVRADITLGTEAVRGCETWVKDADRVSLIKTARELDAEAYRMRHCVASYLPAAINGGAILFHAKIAKSEVTVHLRPSDAGPVIVQAAGRANRKLSAREAAVLTVWLADLNEALHCCRTGGEPVLQGEFAR